MSQLGEPSAAVNGKAALEERLLKALSSIFTFHEGEFSDSYGPNEISGWDSLNHLNLIMALQNEFGIEFDFEDIMGIKVIGDIKNILARKMK